MKRNFLKYVFFFLSALLLCYMVLTSRGAGVSCDEILHYNHSEAVYRYFESEGTDRSALNTPVSNLKYYGQSFDNLVTFAAKGLGIENIYPFRNLMSSLAGWITVLITALFALSLSGYRSAIFVILLFGFSPTFLGHAQNNLKDIPFALSYIASTFLITKYLVSGKRISLPGILLITFSIAFSISIRAGGLVTICYLCFFSLLLLLIKYYKTREFVLSTELLRASQIAAISLGAWMLSIVLWPFALQAPFKNVIDSYKVMAHFPSTFRQIFEGKNEWSDFMPWYYLPKSMLITIPLIVLAGLILFSILSYSRVRGEKKAIYAMIIFTIVFPMVFVIAVKSNLYSSWRQFLFLYPAIVLLAATGYNFLCDLAGKMRFKLIVMAGFLFLAFNPVKFMAEYAPYSYIYYNQLVGGLEGALGNYETDYYYISHREASEWLKGYLVKKKQNGPLKVGATYSIDWLFRNNPEIETSVFRYEERSQYDWDYAIIVNRYIDPNRLKNGLWPPDNAIHTIYADGIPICTVLERRTKDDFYGYTALNEGRSQDAIKFYERALKYDDDDELIFYNFGAALYNEKEYLKADSVLQMAIILNPGFETGLMYLGNIAKSKKKNMEAAGYYERVIKANRKYYEAYVGLAEVNIGTDNEKARYVLRSCLRIEPRYKPAISALADTYMSSDPEMAKKYDDIANSIK